MVQIALRRPDNIAYIVNDMGMHYICVGFSGDTLEYTCRQKFPLDKAEREALGSLGKCGKLSEDPEEARRQEAAVVDMAYYKGRDSELHKGEAGAFGAGAGRAEFAALAARILAVTADSPKWDKGSLRRPWYIMNISHPVVDKLLERYCMKNGISRNFPLSDTERLVFELQLLRPGVLREVEAALEMAEADNRHLKSTG